MSSSYVKGRLKASREAIQAKDWSTALEAVNQALDEERDNYNALVFKGLALLNLGKHDESERSYRRAVELMPKQALAWQGLDRFYTETQQWDGLAGVLEEQMDLAVESEEATKLAELQQRLVALRREHGDSMQIAQALGNYLPQSRYYDLLSSLPAPDQTNPEATPTFQAQMAVPVESLGVVQEIIALHETREKTTLDREVEKSRTRLDSAGKSREQLRAEIGIGIWEQSPLPGLYEQVLAHSNASDEARREAEHKLLVYRSQLLKALPNPRARLAAPTGTAAQEGDQAERDERAQQRKEAALASVKELAEGIVTINIPDELAWTHVLEWTDVFYLTELDRVRLRAFIGHFPRSGLALSFEALLLTIRDEQFLKEQKELQEKTDVEQKSADPLVLALDGLEQAPTSTLAHRIAAVLYLRDRDWLSASEVSTAGLALAKRQEGSLCIDLSQSKAALEASLAASLTYLYPPQHHARATRLCDGVLAHNEADLDTLMCRATIQQAASRWQQARASFVQAEQISGGKMSDPALAHQQTLAVFTKPGRDARLEIAWCDVHLDRLDEAEQELRGVLDDFAQDADASTSDEARIWWRLGHCLWQKGGEYRTSRDHAFKCFITALKKDAVYAPAFASLGHFYNDVSDPPDRQRATKCYQKAFELDASQSDAARQLAEIYSQEDDWDLVDLVARRTIEAEGGSWILQGSSNVSTRRHITENAWAWSAIGSTELARGNYEKSIVALQVALRSFPNAAHLWMRLGEAYVASQRFSAAIKAFERAGSLQGKDDIWQSQFSIASMQHQLGMYDEAIDAFEELAQSRSADTELIAICAAARLDRARRDAREGYALRASRAVMLAVAEASSALHRNTELDAAWKVAADGLLFLAEDVSLEAEQAADFLRLCAQPLLELGAKNSIDEDLKTITAVRLDETLSSLRGDDSSASSTSDTFLAAAGCFYKLRAVLSAGNDKVAGSVWMDIAVALDTLKSRHLHRGAVPENDKVQDCHKQALACVKEALKLEPGNEMFWLSLGNLAFESGITLAQHCYIKAIECNARGAIPWTNLGFLYFVNEDVDLAHECFVRAQTLEPDYAPVWVGHALIARARADHGAAFAAFQNAYNLCPGEVLEAAYGLASSTIQSRSAPQGSRKPNAAQLRTASFALASFLSRRPNDAAALHLSALLAEQLGDISLAIERIDAGSSIIEAQYEEEESDDKAQLFAVCMSNVGRIHLANNDPDRALESFEMSLGLLEGTQDDHHNSRTLSRVAVERARLGAHCGIGLAHAAKRDWQKADDSLREALNETRELARASSDAEEKRLYAQARQALTAQLAQVLFARGDLDGAEDLLMGELASEQDLRLMTLLSAISAHRGDVEQLDVAVSDIQELISTSRETIDSAAATQAIALLISVLTRQGKVSDIIQLFDEARPGAADLRLDLAKCLLQAWTSTSEEEGALRKSYLARAQAEIDAAISAMLAGQSDPHSDNRISSAYELHAIAALANSESALPAEVDEGDGSNAQSGLVSLGSERSQTSALRGVILSPDHDASWTLLQSVFQA